MYESAYLSLSLFFTKPRWAFLISVDHLSWTSTRFRCAESVHHCCHSVNTVLCYSQRRRLFTPGSLFVLKFRTSSLGSGSYSRNQTIGGSSSIAFCSHWFVNRQNALQLQSYVDLGKIDCERESVAPFSFNLFFARSLYVNHSRVPDVKVRNSWGPAKNTPVAKTFRS